MKECCLIIPLELFYTNTKYITVTGKGLTGRVFSYILISQSSLSGFLMAYYELLEHTADLGIRVWGRDLKELFIHSAKAMYELITDTSKVQLHDFFTVTIQAQDKDELLRNWLSELLYYFSVKEILLREFTIDQIDNNMVVSAVRGEQIDRSRHSLMHEIKAVTFHNLKITRQGDDLHTQIIFDV